MKKLSKILVISLLALVIVIALAACGGGAPGYINNPPEKPADLVTQLKADGWEVFDTTNDDGFAMITGYKYSYDKEKEDELEDTDKVTEEIVIVFYLDDEDAAKAYKKVWEILIDYGKKDLPNGVSFSYSVSQKGKTVSIYMSLTGLYGDVDSSLFF